MRTPAVRSWLLCYLFSAVLSGSPAAATANGSDDLNARHGYAAAIPVSEAVTDFNRRSAADQVGSLQPALKGEELLAAIRGATVRDLEGFPPELRKGVRRIADDGVMPKGSYLRFVPHLFARNGFDIDVWWIDLQLDLDRFPTDLMDVPQYSLRVRTSYVRATPAR